jgi:glycerophosphoryl diester phosphodiesterase
MTRLSMLALALAIVALSVLVGPVRAAADARVLNIAHRGARSLAPENTLEAFRIGITLCKAPMIELDVHISKDGVPVVVHDDTLERCSDVQKKFPDRAPWRVMDFTAAEILSLDAGSWFVEKDPFGQIKAGAVPAADVDVFRSGSVRVPTLRSVLALVAELKCRVNIELKNFTSYYPGIAEKTIEEVRRAHLESKVLFSSFDHELLFRLKDLAPEIPRAALVDAPIYPMTRYIAKDLGAVAYNPSKEVLGFLSAPWFREQKIRRDLIDHAREAGLKVFVYTVNDPAEMKTLIDAGVDGLFTDFPQRLAQILADRK